MLERIVYVVFVMFSSALAESQIYFDLFQDENNHIQVEHAIHLRHTFRNARVLGA